MMLGPKGLGLGWSVQRGWGPGWSTTGQPPDDDRAGELSSKDLGIGTTYNYLKYLSRVAEMATFREMLTSAPQALGADSARDLVG